MTQLAVLEQTSPTFSTGSSPRITPVPSARTASATSAASVLSVASAVSAAAAVSGKEGNTISKYDHDPRVKREGEGYWLPFRLDGDWHIAPTGTGGWVAYGANRAVMDECDCNRRRKIFPSADDAIAYLLGPPR